MRVSRNKKKLSVTRIGHIHGKRRYEINYRANTYDCVDVPMVRISGMWMRKFNFYAGDRINIKATRNKIVITKPAKLKSIAK